MKSLFSLTQKVEAWWQNYQRREGFLRKINNPLLGKSAKQVSETKTKIVSHRHKKRRQQNSLLILAIAIVALTSVIGYRFYNQPQLDVGTISPVTIQAPRDGRFEDEKTTQDRRKQVQTGVIPLLKQNRETTAQIKLQVSKYLEQIDRLRKFVAPFPFVDGQILSQEIQKYIRSSSESELKTILETVERRHSQNLPESTKPANNIIDVRLQQTINELQAYRQKVSASDYNALLARIALVRYRYSQAWKKLQQAPIEAINAPQISTLLDLQTDT